MTYLQAGTYIFKTVGASAVDITVDNSTDKLMGGTYHLVKVKSYASIDESLISPFKVPDGTIAITIP